MSKAKQAVIDYVIKCKREKVKVSEKGIKKAIKAIKATKE